MIPAAEALRYDYPDLHKDSVVVDAGAYQGNWSKVIHEKYGCIVLAFEPVKAFFDTACETCKAYRRINLFHCALGGHFRYVRLSASAGAVVVGQAVFWDTVANAADNLFQVTTAESGTTDASMNLAGIVLNNGWSVGTYSIIQDVGPTYCKFRATLTGTGAIGSRVFAAAAGGADLGFADVIDSSNPTLFSDVSKMMGRYYGIAIDAPTNGGLKRVYVNMHNVRG